MDDLAVLFEHTPADNPFPDELDAVAKGHKPVLWVSFPRSEIDSNEPADYYSELVTRSLDNGLSIVGNPSPGPRQIPDSDHVDIFILRAQQIWRVSAILETNRLIDVHGWSEAFEATRSRLLGYDETMIGRWLDRLRKLGALSGFATLYFLLSQKQLGLIECCARRCFPPGCFSPALLVFHNYEPQAIKDEVANRLSIGRVAVRYSYISQLFSSNTASHIVSINLNDGQEVEVNQQLQSRIQILTPNGWS